MAFNRKGSRSSRIDLAFDSTESPPPIAALFLIHFDIRAGYTISWKKSLPNVELENLVEFKSLPSGLHNVKEDLIYFVHEQYAGISAFVNQPSGESDRNALMLAVGVLVPLSHGRLGKNWKHAEGLKDLARRLAENLDDRAPLEEYWEHFQLSDQDGLSPPGSPHDSLSSRKSKQPPQEQFKRNRALSDATALATSKPALAPFHPVLSSPELIEEFGPLVFPLYRAALLRRRVLLMGDAPVEMACNFVYNLSLLSSIPHHLIPLLRPSAQSLLRPQPLFNIGIHDMPYLAAIPPDHSSAESCWIACTSDKVLGLRQELYDVLVQLPPAHSKQAEEKVYPTITIPDPSQISAKQSKPARIKATQRDARRYWHLKSGLSEFSRLDSALSTDEDDSDALSTFSSTSVIEPLSWPLLAYSSFIWWASAGEKKSDAPDEESEQDARLLLTEDESYSMLQNSASQRSSGVFQERNHQPQEVALVTYFRRLTTQIFTVLSEAIIRQDGMDGDEADSDRNASAFQDNDAYEDDGEGSTLLPSNSGADDPNDALLSSANRSEGDTGDDPVGLTTSDMTEMGLDPWSDTDRAFVEELSRVWFGRNAEVHGGRIICCGVQIL